MRCLLLIRTCCQMASFAVVAGLRPSRAVSILLAVLHGGSFGGANTAASTAGFCVSHSLTSRFKVMLEAGLQLSVGVAMVLLVAAGAACRVRRETKGRRPSIQVSVALRELAYGAEPLLPASLQLTTDPDHGAASSSARVYGREVEDRSMHTRLVTAAVNFALTAYGTVTLALMRLLHCVHVPGSPGGQQRLYIAGSVVCEYGGWQLPLVVVLIVMCCAPVVLPWVALWSRDRRTVSSEDLGHGHTGPDGYRCRRTRVGVRRALVDAYTDGREYWESVLLAQRLVRACMFAQPAQTKTLERADSEQ
jgi:hypothetical protein